MTGSWWDSGVLIAALSAQEREPWVLVSGLAVVGVLFAGLRLGAWWLERRERDK